MTSHQNDQDTTYPFRRRSLRLPKHDYTWTRGYFVTIRARVHEPLFKIPSLRAILTQEWEALPQRFPGITLDKWGIIHDQMHFILCLNDLPYQPPPTAT